MTLEPCCNIEPIDLSVMESDTEMRACIFCRNCGFGVGAISNKETIDATKKKIAEVWNARMKMNNILSQFKRDWENG